MAPNIKYAVFRENSPCLKQSAVNRGPDNGLIPGRLGGSGRKLAVLSDVQVLLIVFFRLQSCDGAFSHFDLYLIGKFQDKGLVLDRGDDTIDP